ncbi:MAG: alpha-amylase/4-alpha-glucanotransferase domain-containing protein, partial [Pseudomonadota bacterium]
MQALGEARAWLETATISSYLAANLPLGRAYLPAASYPEMMEWALPVAASREFRSSLEECERTSSSAGRFLLGGLWRNFLAKYPESNQLHKLMIEVSRRWHEADRAGSTGKAAQWLAEAQDHLLAGQCNDAYWHGVFGGLYAPHLRSGVERRLIQAETCLDRIESASGKPEVSLESRDFDCDGQKELLIEHPAFGMVVRPADGGTASSLRFKPADVELINSLARRAEAYHEQVRRGTKPPAETSAAGPASIHDRVASKELNLGSFLRYDRYLRRAFRTFIFPAGKTAEDYAALALDEDPALAGGAWRLGTSPETGGFAARQAARASGIEQIGFELEIETVLSKGGKKLALQAVKTLSASAPGGRWRLECTCQFTMDTPAPMLATGLELVFNLLAPNAPDRHFLARTEAGEVRHPLE